ncbi:Dedicator of cytokinesis protein 9 [Liparis tanakae]|uniref:Dedicator of cytokinesis protein 9 n=1 Tax=Liparis tanakae TaxID=230148 RepID=A0A4Z2E5B8_9TELE|nr:Dedicator of cytokinesis protein 9 [Liparis tanakae]
MRNETRLKLFTLDPETQKLDFSGIEPDVKQFEEKFGKRVLVNCNDLSFNLQSCVAENEEGPTTNVEPFYVTLSLFDIQNGRKISSDFHVDLNHLSVRGMVPSTTSPYMNGGGDAHPEGQRLVHGVPEAAMQYPRQVRTQKTHLETNKTNKTTVSVQLYGSVRYSETGHFADGGKQASGRA